MARKTYKPEEIVAKLRQVDVLHSQGITMAEAVRKIGVTEVTYYRWRKEYGGLKTDQLKRLKELQKENERLRRAVSDLTLDKLILAEAARGNFCALSVAASASIMSVNIWPYLSVVSAGYWDSIDRPSDTPRGARQMRIAWWRI